MTRGGRPRQGPRGEAAGEAKPPARAPGPRGAKAKREHVPAPGAGPLALTHPASLAALAIAAAGVLLSVTFWLTDPDLWQHLAVGRAIWTTHAIPFDHVWTWPSYGRHEITPSWLYRALLWPFWAAGGLWGLFAFRWVTSLLAFGLMWGAARRLGARGFAVPFVVVLCAVASRGRSQVRPEMVAGVLLALTVWILEARRAGGPDRSKWLVPIACVWINAHISYFLFFVVLAIHVAGARLAAWRPPAAPEGADAAPAPPIRPLLVIGALSLAACAVNPWGLASLWQPFDFALHQRSEPIFRTIGELMPPTLEENLWNGLPLIAIFWPLLFAWRTRRRGLDPVELGMMAAFGALALMGARFTGFFALAAVPYLGRSLDAWIGTRPLPALAARPASRVAVLAASATLAGIVEWTAPDPREGIGIWMNSYPVGACDYIQRQDLHGPLYNPFFFGGYLLWRFWPERDRLPYMDIHQSGTPASRLLYMRALHDPMAWREMSERERFEVALHSREQVPGDHLIDFLDADTTFALVFLDDSAVLYVRRHGRYADLAARGYRLLSGGRARLSELARRCAEDTTYRREVRAELERQAAGSRFNATAHSLLANIALLDGRRGDARAELEAALAADPFVPRTHQRLGDLAVEDGRPRDALREYAAEKYLHGEPPGIGTGVGRAWEALGDLDRARAAYRGEFRRHPDDPEVMERLRAVEARLAR